MSEPGEMARDDEMRSPGGQTASQGRPLQAAGVPSPPQSLRTCDVLTEGLIYFAVIFSPWAFGTTQRWSVWTMNLAGYCLGALVLAKWAIRRPGGMRGAGPADGGGLAENGSANRWARWCGRMLGLLTILILGYCLTSAINARATYHPSTGEFEYHSFLNWLPHSYDRSRTWGAFWNYLALACSFWALRDWLLTGRGEEGATLQAGPKDERDGGDEIAKSKWQVSEGGLESEAPRTRRHLRLPGRLRRLLWVVCVNGALLALEAVLQRASDTSKLLWLVEPRIIKGAEGQFGPYAYRSNGAQYLGLIWPVALGFWWVLQRASCYQRRPGGSRHLLLPAAMVMAAAPIMSLSRAGAVVGILQIIAAAGLLLRAERKGGPGLKIGLLVFMAATLGLGAWVAADPLAERFLLDTKSVFGGREEMWASAWRMAQDYPVFGTGPDTFDPVFQLYRHSVDEYWPAQLHNDWLETLITFGGVGSSLVLLAVGLAVGRPVLPGGIPVRRVFVAFLWVGVGGCLAHAVVDFPLQIYSILLLFLLLCSILSCLSVEARTSGAPALARSTE